METDKIYKIGTSPEMAMNATKSWESYREAHLTKEELENSIGMTLNVYKIVTSVTEATHSTEDYWEYY